MTINRVLLAFALGALPLASACDSPVAPLEPSGKLAPRACHDCRTVQPTGGRIAQPR